MSNRVNPERTMEEQRSSGKIRLIIMLSSTLAVGFIMGYLASAFVPLVPPPQSPAVSPSAAPGPKLSPSEIDAALKAAHTLLDAGDLQAAWEKYHQILLTDRNHVEALTHLGILLTQSNQPDEAIKLYDRALSLNPQYAHALFDKGQALQAKGDAKGAIKVFREFLALVPPDSDDAKRVKGWIAEMGDSSRSPRNEGSGLENK